MATLSVPSQHSTIQAAINAASNGDTIEIQPGTYNERLLIQEKGLTLEGMVDTEGSTSASSGDRVIVDGDIGSSSGEDLANRQSCLYIENAGIETVNIVNMDFTGGSGQLNWGGGGINVYGSYFVTIEDCNIYSNSGHGGGGIKAYLSAGTIEGCEIYSNTCNGSGISGGGAGIMISSSGKWTIWNTKIQNNTTSSSSTGGALYQVSSEVEIANCLITGNEAHYGSTCRSRNGAGTVFINCTISDNECRVGNGTITFENQAFRETGVYNCVIWDNPTDSYGTGTIVEAGNSNLEVANCCIQEGYPGTSIIETDPRISSVTFRQLASSPIVGAANSTYLPAGIVNDINGQTRTVNTLDMGCFEIQVGEELA